MSKTGCGESEPFPGCHWAGLCLLCVTGPDKHPKAFCSDTSSFQMQGETQTFPSHYSAFLGVYIPCRVNHYLSQSLAGDKTSQSGEQYQLPCIRHSSQRNTWGLVKDIPMAPSQVLTLQPVLAIMEIFCCSSHVNVLHQSFYHSFSQPPAASNRDQQLREESQGKV